MRTIKRIPLHLACLASFLLAVACGSAPPPRQAAPAPVPGAGSAFSEPLAQLRDSYSGIETAKADYQVLLEENSISYDEAGSCEVATHLVLRVLTNEGVDMWSVLDVSWQPWRDSRPVIEARVLRPSGLEAELKAESVVDVGSGVGGNNLRSDLMRRSAPLPNLEPGSLVEIRVIERSREAMPGSGYGRWMTLGRTGPVERRVVSFRLPQGLAFSYRLLGAEAAIVEREPKDGFRGLELTFGRMPGVAKVEPLLPYDQPARPTLVYGTAASWKAVAATYARAVEPLLDPAPLAAYTAKALGTIDAAADPAAAARAIASALRRDVRYTGVYFGANAIVPHAPAETLASGYGDCKDQASLLVACLRAAGIEAEMALLSSGTDCDIFPEVPALEFFNHAIAYLPKLGMWIDPTAFYGRPGVLPYEDRLRHALLVAADGPGLAPTPDAPLGEDWFRETRTIELSEDGKAARVEERNTAGGAADLRFRASFDDASRKEHEEYLENYGKRTYDAEKAAGSFGDPADLETPFETVASCEGAGYGWTNDSLAEAYLKTGDLFGAFPGALELDGKDHPKREAEAFLPTLCTYTIEFRVIAPTGYRLRSLPDRFALDLGKASLSASFESPSPERLNAVFTITPRDRRWSAAEVDALRAAAKKYFDSTAPLASFESVGQAAASEGRFAAALKEFRELQRLHPKEALHHIQASNVLISAGFPSEALPEVEEAVRLEPDSASAHKNLAFACLYDPFGRQFGKGADLERAGKEYLRAFELDPKAYENLFNYAIVQEMGDDGEFRGKGAHLDEAVKAFERAKSEIEAYGHAERYLNDLFLLGRYAEVIEAGEALKDRQKGASFLLAAYAERDGVDAAIKRATALVADPATRRSALGNAATALFSAREYAAAAELFVASARGTSNLASMMAVANIVRGIRRFDGPGKEGSAEEAFFELFEDSVQQKDFPLDLCAPSVRASVEKQLRDPSVQDQMIGLKRSLGQFGMGDKPLMDLLRSCLKFSRSESGHLAIVNVSAPSLGVDYIGDLFFLEEEGGRDLLLDMDGLSGLAAEASRLLDAGDTETARSWIQAARDLKKIRSTCKVAVDKAVAALLPQDPRSEAELRLSVALLGLDIRDPAFALRYSESLLSAARAEADGGRRGKLYGYALALARTGAAPSLPAIVEEAAKSGASDAEAAFSRAEALLHCDFDELAEKAALAGLQQFPGDQALSSLVARALEKEGKFKEVVDFETAAIDAGVAQDRDYNSVAWSMLFLGEPDLARLDAWGLARRFDETKPAALHTVACVNGAAGRYEEAHAAFEKLLGAKTSLDQSALWVAHGFLARSFGLAARARASFAKAVELEEDKSSPASSGALATIWKDRP
jgi:Flp pilus assembly protein TadD